jgi:hypothetical protein
MSKLLSFLVIATFVAFASAARAQTCDPKDPKCVPCDPKTQKCDGADCSPGFYKNHVASWCAPGSPADTSGIECQDGHTYTCSELVCLLTAEPPCKSSLEQRAFAKACLDAISPADICSD